MTRAKAIAKLNQAEICINAAIDAFNESGSMCEATYDALLDAKRKIQMEIVDMHAPRSKVSSNTLELIHANCD